MLPLTDHPITTSTRRSVKRIGQLDPRTYRILEEDLQAFIRLSSLHPASSRFDTQYRDVSTSRRTILRVPLLVLQACRRPMRGERTTRALRAGEDSACRVRLRSALKATSCLQYWPSATIRHRLWILELRFAMIIGLHTPHDLAFSGRATQ